ncbi:hypothetical protein HWB76_gp043 [Streptomyces phage Blueeyedbeauty]|uniref:Uncharacterized protein n=1 Tax=Streptomyces phage Blueeyedbeauty TaxID=2250336 RepID=A0A345L255_9CAUD|nr:hypothetical protein HWB76_gp043 [Streptomyces phage Blueeyedbeauty]AXH49357.1 hypothetical protein SEA_BLUEEYEDBEAUTY_250 [Streptomyces phage Blueeyedbeauty]
MLVVLVNDASDLPWSFKGWKVNYKRIGQTTYGYQFVDPSGTVHSNACDASGFYKQYNVKSVEHLLTEAVNSSNARYAMEKYLLKHGEVETVEL